MPIIKTGRELLEYLQSLRPTELEYEVCVGGYDPEMVRDLVVG
jgi:hypothetical protein